MRTIKNHAILFVIGLTISTGAFSFSGNMDLAIAIRTLVIKDGMVHLQAGAGIVADSDPAAEWQETVNKAMAARRAIEIAEGGLD